MGAIVSHAGKFDILDYHRETDLAIDFTVLLPSGSPLHLTGATALWRVFRAYRHRVFLEKSIGSGIAVVDAATGKLRVTVARADTRDLAPTTYRHELRVRKDGVEDVVIDGSFAVLASPRL
jgi:hypothetical protein